MRHGATLWPNGNPFKQVEELLGSNAFVRTRMPPVNLGDGRSGQMAGIVYDSELQHGNMGLGWLFPFVFGPSRAFGKTPPRGVTRHVVLLKTLRAGAADMGARSPVVSQLRRARIAVIGVGALGAPVAVGLARSGCGSLNVLDQDIVEPGNAVRWPLGAQAWGFGKVHAIGGFIAANYPWTELTHILHRLGHAPESEELRDENVLPGILDGVQLVIDATASFGINGLLWDHCRRRGLPLITLFASPDLQGGVVARFSPRSGCPLCLEHAWHDGEISRPPGMGSDVTIQPPGCAEATFTGADHDLQELSLEGIRMAVETLERADESLPSVVHTLRLRDVSGRRVPPQWTSTPLPRHEKCQCVGA
jgi:hypothetical protein